MLPSRSVLYQFNARNVAGHAALTFFQLCLDFLLFWFFLLCFIYVYFGQGWGRGGAHLSAASVFGFLVLFRFQFRLFVVRSCLAALARLRLWFALLIGVLFALVELGWAAWRRQQGVAGDSSSDGLPNKPSFRDCYLYLYAKRVWMNANFCLIYAANRGYKNLLARLST